jgi:hypothetical protein
MAGDPGKGDPERSILDACRSKHSCQLVDRALPRAGGETPAVDFAFRQPFATVIGTSGFLEWMAIDRERICHSKSVFKDRMRGSDFPAEQP